LLKTFNAKAKSVLKQTKQIKSIKLNSIKDFQKTIGCFIETTG